MQVFSIAKGFNKVFKYALCELSIKELDRLRALRLWQQTKDTRLICETFGMSRATLYRWVQRFNPHDLISLREGSRRPRRVRRPVWSYELVMAVKHLREQYPRWGKDKLVVLLREQGYGICDLCFDGGAGVAVSEETRGISGAYEKDHFGPQEGTEALCYSKTQGI